MSVFRGDPARRPSVAVTALYALGSIIMIGLMSAVPALALGHSVSEVLNGIFLSPKFWVATGLPVVAFSVAFMVSYPYLWRNLIVRRGRVPGAAYRRGLLFATASGLLYLFVVARGLWNRISGGMTVAEALSSLVIQLILAAALVIVLVYDWLSPSEEKAKAIETGDYRRVNDERHRLLAMRSAHTVLSIALVAILLVGSAVDILVYHTYPVRSFVDAGLLLFAWQAAYVYWRRRI
ncbi:MAG TPA: hypothetical protein VGL40_13555 [Bacillota bacterium]|jgi:hypothetical protein